MVPVSTQSVNPPARVILPLPGRKPLPDTGDLPDTYTAPTPEGRRVQLVLYALGRRLFPAGTRRLRRPIPGCARSADPSA
jgi:hypothetical protein